MFPCFLRLAHYSFCLLSFLIFFQDIFSIITFFFHINAFVKPSKKQAFMCAICIAFVRFLIFVRKHFFSIYQRKTMQFKLLLQSAKSKKPGNPKVSGLFENF